MDSGIHRWSGAPSGTAAGVVTFTDVLSVERNKSLALQGASLQTGTGITFPATQNASSNANTLDDYEEGTWTAYLSDGTTNVSLGTQYYTKIGNVVTVKFGKYNTDFSSLSGSVGLQLIGLPFVAASVSGQDVVLIASITSNNPVLYEVTSTTTGGYLYQGTNGAGTNSFFKGDFAATNGSLWGNFSYLTN
jgi:hypothetical protein